MLNIYPLAGTQYYRYIDNDNGFDLYYGAIEESDPPNVKEDDYFILICLHEDNADMYRVFYLISLLEPKYVHGSRPLPDELRAPVIKAIYQTYRDGIKAINLDRRITIFDPNRPIPNYNALKSITARMTNDKQYWDYLFKERASRLMINGVLNYKVTLFLDIVPDCDIVVYLAYGYIDEYSYPDPNEDDFCIMIWIMGNDYSWNCYRISLTEPKYTYGSDPLPDKYKSQVVAYICDTYKDGITSINDGIKYPVFDLSVSMPDYNLL